MNQMDFLKLKIMDRKKRTTRINRTTSGRPLISGLRWILSTCLSFCTFYNYCLCFFNSVYFNSSFEIERKLITVQLFYYQTDIFLTIMAPANHSSELNINQWMRSQEQLNHLFNFSLTANCRFDQPIQSAMTINSNYNTNIIYQFIWF